jgi:hypothetical protein
MCLDSSSKRLERPHPKLDHSGPDVGPSRLEVLSQPWWAKGRGEKFERCCIWNLPLPKVGQMFFSSKVQQKK